MLSALRLSASPAEIRRANECGSLCRGLTPPTQHEPPCMAEALRLHESLKTLRLAINLRHVADRLGSDLGAISAAYPAKHRRSRFEPLAFIKDFAVRGRHGAELFVLGGVARGLKVAAAGTSAAALLAADVATDAPDNSGSSVAAEYENKRLGHVPPAELQVNMMQLSEYEASFEQCWLQAQEGQWTEEEDTVARGLSSTSTLELCRLQLLLQRARGVDVRCDNAELKDLSVLTQHQSSDRARLLRAKAGFVNHLVRNPRIRYNLRDLQTGPREAADGFRSIEARQPHILNAAAISAEHAALEGEEQRALANDAYISTGELAEFVQVFADVAAGSSCTASAARLEEASGRQLGREGFMPQHYLDTLACAYGSDAAKRGARGGSGQLGTYAEKDVSKAAGGDIGHGFDLHSQQLAGWETACEEAEASGQEPPPKPTYDSIIGMVRFTPGPNGGTPLLYAQLATLEALPWAEPSHPQLLLEENDLAASHSCFYDKVGKGDAAYFSGSATCQRSLSSEERWERARPARSREIARLHTISGAVEWCSGAHGSLAAKGASQRRGGGWCSSSGKGMRREARIGAIPSHRHDYPVVWGYYRIFRFADGIWRGHPDATRELNKRDAAAEAYLRELRSDKATYFSRVA